VPTFTSKGFKTALFALKSPTIAEVLAFVLVVSELANARAKLAVTIRNFVKCSLFNALKKN